MKVMETGSYADASKALDVSPPAISLAMGRLQQTIDKELFIRGNGKIQPTAAAVSLYDNIYTQFLTIEKVVNTFDTFSPQDSTIQFFLSIPEEFHPNLLHVLPYKNNQNITFLLQDQTDDEEQAINHLRHRSIDLVVDSFILEDKSLEHELLFEDDIVLVVSTSHPFIDCEISHDDYQTLPQSVLSLRRNKKLALNLFIDEQIKIKRNIVNEASSMLANMLVVSGTQLFCHTTRSLALQYQQTLGLKIIEPPIPLKRIPFYMQWHKSNSTTPSHKWLRERVKHAVKNSD